MALISFDQLKIQAVIAPFAGCLGGHFRLAAAVEGPFVGGDDLLHHVEGIGGGVRGWRCRQG